jgi:flagellar hook protein FlgE
MTSLSSAVDGMNRAADSFDAAAARIARTGQSAGNAPGAPTAAITASGAVGDTVNLSSSMVSLLEARDNFEANTRTVAVSDRMTQAALNMIG